ncbi:hypothetical protein, partial [Paenibacillus popilliae]|uniref:hypothetical protein n=1 Tax=Paenibacillus popilliae TaxID=78057 RepID=UPI0005A8998E
IGTDKKLWAVVSLITVVTMLLQATVPDPELENGWNGLFFIFGNSYLYALFLLPLYLVVINEIGNEGGAAWARAVVIRLGQKTNWFLTQFVVLLLVSLWFAAFVIGMVLVQSILTWGYDPNWSQFTVQGDDKYTYFATEFTPWQALAFYGIRYFWGLLMMGTLFLCLQCITKRRSPGGCMIAVFFYVALQAFFKVGNIPLLNILDIGNHTIYSFNHNVSSPLLFIIQSHIALL